MKFYALDDYPALASDRVFKAPLLGSLIWLVLLGFFTGGTLYVGLHDGLVFGAHLPPSACYGSAALAACASWVAYCSVRARRKPMNWIVRGNDSGLAIKYRSFRNWRMPAGDVQILQLGYPEIAWVRMVKEWCDTAGLDGENRRTLEFYLDLALVNRDTALLESRLQEEANRKWSIVTHDYPVRVLPGGIIRIKWRNQGGGAYSTPKDVVTWLGRFVRIIGSETAKVDLTTASTPEEQDAHIRELIHRGDHLAAIALVRTVYGCSTTEAKTYVDQLQAGRTTG